MLGDINMSMTVMFNDATGDGRFTGKSQAGDVYGQIKSTRELAAQEPSGTGLSFTFHGTVTVTGGTRLYAHSHADHMTFNGELATNRAVFELTFYGRLQLDKPAATVKSGCIPGPGCAGSGA